MGEEKQVITIALTVTRVAREDGGTVPEDLVLANQIHAALRDASRAADSRFTYVGADIEWPGFAAAFEIDEG